MSRIERSRREKASHRAVAAVAALVVALCAAAQVHAATTSLGLQLSPIMGAGTPVETPVAQVSAAKAPAVATAGGGYRIDTGDSVSVTVYREPDLSVVAAKVRDDGTVSFPLLGDLTVRGLTSNDLKNVVTRALQDGYLKNPNVTVSIDAYRLYYIKGEVNRPGGYSYIDGLTVEKAVALAGGLTERASERSIKLIREDRPDEPLDGVAPGTAILPGDVITIGESFF